MLKPGGYSLTTQPGKADVECDTFTCKHCCGVTFVAPRCRPEDLGGRCTCCDGLICSNCVGKGCMPLEEQLRMMEDSRYKRRHIYKMG